MKTSTAFGIGLAVTGVAGIAFYLLSRDSDPNKPKAGDRIIAVDQVDVYKAAGQSRYGVFHPGNYIGTILSFNSNGNWFIIKESGLWIPSVFLSKVKKAK